MHHFVSKDVYDIFEMTKFTELMNIEKALRVIDVTGQEKCYGVFFSSKRWSCIIDNKLSVDMIFNILWLPASAGSFLFLH